ncbi:MAG: AAA family ATPase [bacterium]|nr:AAA family ATPase [bacterium]
MQTYRQFYNLTRQPFTKQITPLYRYRQLEELQKHLCGLCEEGGIGLVSGQVGMGKTSAVRDYLGTLDERAFHIFYCGKTYDVKGIVKEFISSVGVKPAFYRNDIFLQTSNLVERLYEEHRKRSIFVVDEAHLLEDKALEELRLLTNFCQDSMDYLILIFIGHPAIRQKLRRPATAALWDRVTMQYSLEGLSMDETQGYVTAHLEYAGASADIFTFEAMSTIYEHSMGAPRKINRIATECLKRGADAMALPIDVDLVRQVVRANPVE